MRQISTSLRVRGMLFFCYDTISHSFLFLNFALKTTIFSLLVYLSYFIFLLSWSESSDEQYSNFLTCIWRLKNPFIIFYLLTFTIYSINFFILAFLPFNRKKSSSSWLCIHNKMCLKMLEEATIIKTSIKSLH